MRGGINIRISGIEQVLKNLNWEIKLINNRSRAGLRDAALVVRRRSQQLTPVDIGNLKASAYTEAYDTPLGPGAEIGYTADYAVFVHEIDRHHKTGKPIVHQVGQWKFLETALKEKSKEVLEIIRRHADIEARRMWMNR